MTETPAPSDHYEPASESEAIDRLTALVKQYPEAGQAVVPAIHELAANPRPTGSTQVGGSSTRRLLLGYFRVLYSVPDDPPLVRIFLVGRAGRPR